MNICDLPKLGLVYRLLIGNYYYTGSTLETIHHRIKTHQTAYSKNEDEQTRKLYKHIYENGGWDHVKVEILEKDIEETNLKQREQSYINKEDSYCLNSYNVISPAIKIPKKVSIRSDKRKEYDRLYYEQHKERLKQQRMENYVKVKNDPEKHAKMLEVSRNAQARYYAKKKSSGILS